MNNAFFNRLLATAALLGMFGVMFGAFGAHFLKARLDEGNLETIKTGVLYLFIHVLATLIVCLLAQHNPSRGLKGAGIAFITGIVLFSGSLFVIGTASLTGFPVPMIGFITPLGGIAFILGWILLIFSPKNK